MLSEIMFSQNLPDFDPEIYELLKDEKRRQRSCINLIAGENYISKAVLQTLSCSLSNNYADGYPDSRHGHSTEIVDKIEKLCQERALATFGLDPQVWSVNVQPHSASGANFATFLGAVGPGGRIMGLDVPDGGHRTHGLYNHEKAIAATSMVFETLPYKLDPHTGLIDYEDLLKMARLFKPKLIIAGTSAYSRELGYGKFREICNEVKALLMADMAHIGGMVATKVLPSPFDYADIVTTTTHKSLRGPRSGLIFYRKALAEVGQRLDAAVYPALQSSPHLNVIAAASVALKEAQTKEFREYQAQVLKNAKVLSEKMKELGYSIFTDGTDNHLVLVDISPLNLCRDRLGYIQDEVGVLVSRRPAPGGITPRMRLGTPAITSRLLKEPEMETVVDFVHQSILLAQKYQNCGGDTLASFAEFCRSDSKASVEINELKKKVDQFISGYFMPGLDEY